MEQASHDLLNEISAVELADSALNAEDSMIGRCLEQHKHNKRSELTDKDESSTYS